MVLTGNGPPSKRDRLICCGSWLEAAKDPSNTLEGSTFCVVWCDSPVVRINSGGERG